MKELQPPTLYINTFNQVLAELSSQGLDFKEEIKALALLLSLLTSWEVFYTTATNGSMKLMLDEAIKQILLEDLQRKSKGHTIKNNAEAHFLADMAQRASRKSKLA